jgi:hypothetical protein
MTIPEFRPELVEPGVRIPVNKEGPNDFRRNRSGSPLLRLHHRDDAAAKKSQNTRPRCSTYQAQDGGGVNEFEKSG